MFICTVLENVYGCLLDSVYMCGCLWESVYVCGCLLDGVYMYHWFVGNCVCVYGYLLVGCLLENIHICVCWTMFECLMLFMHKDFC